MDLLGFFAIRTGAPFGYLVLSLAFLGAVGAGIAQLSRGLREGPRGRVRAAIGGGLLSTALVVVVANVAYEAALEFNPRVAAADLVGIWRHRGATLNLRPDGTYECRSGGACANVGEAGRWDHGGDFQLQFTPRGHVTPIVQRVVRYAGELRLTQEVEDPDLWDGVLTFRHSVPAS